MDYSEIVKILRANQIPVKDLSEHLGMTTTGFKRSIDKETLPMKSVVPLCNFLHISINAFFGIDERSDVSPGALAQHNSNHKAKSVVTYDSAATEALVQQLKEKDAQINKLLDIIASK